MEGQDPDQLVGGPGTDLQIGGKDQCAYTWGDKILTPGEGGNRPKDASEDNAATDMDRVFQKKVPTLVFGISRFRDTKVRNILVLKFHIAGTLKLAFTQDFTAN